MTPDQRTQLELLAEMTEEVGASINMADVAAIRAALALIDELRAERDRLKNDVDALNRTACEYDSACRAAEDRVERLEHLLEKARGLAEQANSGRLTGLRTRANKFLAKLNSREKP